jgi:GMP synthase PP-ATPase subunit
MEGSIADKVADEVRALAPELQHRVLEFARALAVSEPRGVPGRLLLRFAGEVTPEDAQLMRKAIDQGCEKIDSHEC